MDKTILAPNKCRIFIFFFSLMILLVGCRDSKPKVPFALPAEDKVAPVEIFRLDEILYKFAQVSPEKRNNIIKDYYGILEGYSQIVDDTDTVDTETVMAWSTGSVITMFEPEVLKYYPNTSALNMAVGRIVSTCNLNHLIMPADRFVATVWSDSRSIIVIDTLKTAYIALNHYLGMSHEAYSGLPLYRRIHKTSERLPVDIAEAMLALSYPFLENESSNVMSRMLYEGSLAIGKQALVPDAPLNDILGFSSEELDQIAANEDFIWKQLTKDNILYSKDAELISNLFDLRPNSSRISPDAPGRAIRYLGYKIVSDYIGNNKDATLKFLLSPEFYNSTLEALRNSGYSL